jgi:hypothetical protein
MLTRSITAKRSTKKQLAAVVRPVAVRAFAGRVELEGAARVRAVVPRGTLGARGPSHYISGELANRYSKLRSAKERPDNLSFLSAAIARPLAFSTTTFVGRDSGLPSRRNAPPR